MAKRQTKTKVDNSGLWLITLLVAIVGIAAAHINMPPPKPERDYVAEHLEQVKINTAKFEEEIRLEALKPPRKTFGPIVRHIDRNKGY